MGIRVELKLSRKMRANGTKGEADIFPTTVKYRGEDPRALDQQSLDIDISEQTPRIKYRPPGIQTSPPADALSNSPDSAKHLISGGQGSSDPNSPLSYSSPSVSSPTTPPCKQGCGDLYHRTMKKKSDSQGLNPLRFGCSQRNKDDLRPSRWDSGRWSPGTDFPSSSGSKKSACYCAAGVTGDVAAVCCCPLSLLHLLALALIKLPSAAVGKLVVKLKRRINVKRKRAAIHEDENESVGGASSFPPSRSRSYEEGEIQTWAPHSLGFMYFGSPDGRVGGEFSRGVKS